MGPPTTPISQLPANPEPKHRLDLGPVQRLGGELLLEGVADVPQQGAVVWQVLQGVGVAPRGGAHPSRVLMCGAWGGEGSDGGVLS